METQNKKCMSDKERLDLAAKLDQDLEEFISGLEKRPYTEGWPEDRWEEEMAKHPFFMKNPPAVGEKLHPLMEGLQQLKYDPNENTPLELAAAYKDDGNFNFKHKNYRLAIIAYTEGIKVNCDDSEMKASLYNNRSAANYFLKNYRSALKDAEMALQFKPDKLKVIVRAANCCYEIQRYETAMEYCTEIFKQKPGDSETIELQKKCINAIKIQERDSRRKKQLEIKENKAEETLRKAILERGINIENRGDAFKLENLKPQVPELAGYCVHLTDDGLLQWPVIFVYPEYKAMDFIQCFQEDQTLIDHLQEAFEEHPPWDKEKKYTPNSINVYFESNKKLFKVEIHEILSNILKNKEFIVRSGTPTFILLVSNSLAEKYFIQQYSIE